VTTQRRRHGVASTHWKAGHARGTDSLSAEIGTLTPVKFTALITGNAALLTKTAGDGQTAFVDQPVPIAPAVTVSDSDGHLARGVVVVFTVAQGNGQITATQATTDTMGLVSPGDWILGLGANQLVASSPGAPSVTFTATGAATATGVTSVVALGTHRRFP
jgi:hypothetical protein